MFPKIKILFLASLGLAMTSMFLSLPAFGTVTGFSTCTGGAFCSGPTKITIGGKAYIQVSGLMEGSTTLGDSDFGPYKAPMTVMYPARSARCGGTGVVDMVNNSVTPLFFNDLGPTVPYIPPVGASQILLGDPYLGKRGMVLAFLQHQKVSSFGIDPIEHGKAMGYYPPEAGIPATPNDEFLSTLIVMNDGAEFVRNLGDYIPGACDSTRVVAYGISQSARHLRLLFLNAAFPGNYDGALLMGNVLPTSTGPTPEEAGKMITVNSETDVQLLDAEGVRGDTGWYRVYEIAGVSHAPMEGGDIAPIFAQFGFKTRQDPARVSPVLRTMMDDLVDWIDETSTPPPSAYLDASSTNPHCDFVTAGNIYEVSDILYPPGDDFFLDCPTLRDPDRGNALPGGVRLPHVMTKVHGEWVGAPLGQYSGVETVTPLRILGILPNISGVPVLGGVFTRYTDQELAQKYGKIHKDKIQDVLSLRYLFNVAGAAEYAELKGWINKEEKWNYIRIALECMLRKTKSLSDEDINACHGF